MNATWTLPSLAIIAVAVCSLTLPDTDAVGHRNHLVADHFTTSEQCAVCHTTAPGASAMLSQTGDDVSPYSLWQGTMMANAFRDPYFRAQIRKESAASGEHIQELCLRCHTPMMHHQARMNGDKPPRLADVDGDTFADDGVSCTVCHMIDSEGLGDEKTFSGRPNFTKERRIFGPFANPTTQPMQNLVRYTPTHAPHIQKSALCATCHTLTTEHHGTPFLEQSPYLEWRNSQFNDENGATDESRTCQQCHMAETGATRIARSPMGFDFNIPVREGYRGHAFVGGNAFMLDMLQRHREDLDVVADSRALQRMATATRRQLAESTARLSLSEIERVEQKVKFSATIENLTGHKFPSGYPARRAWLHVTVHDGRQLVFESGAFDDKGRVVGIGDEMRQPHWQTISRPDQALIYEMIAQDPEGEPTTYLTKMVKRQKDNRLLPKGWKSDGPHTDQTAPVGTADDADFVGGTDTVHFEVPLPERVRGRLQVTARVYYQTVPPAWVDALRGLEAEECVRFVGYYDDADKTPETVAVAVRREQ